MINKNMFAIVGNWGFIPCKSKGLSIYKYNPENAELSFKETILEDVYVGQNYVDVQNNIIYIVNEIGSRRNEIGGGGYVMALKIDTETGETVVINEMESLSPEPSYFCLDKSGQYALVAHHVDGGHVTKIYQDNEGEFNSKTLFDDASLALFEIKKDGSLGNIKDVYITKGEGIFGPRAISHQHCVVCDPSGELFVVCDKGTDKIHAFQIDRENGKIVFLADKEVEFGSSPRYCAFHQDLPFLYVNNEHKTVVFTFTYDTSTGELDQVSKTNLLINEEEAEGLKKVEAGDILVHPSGKNLYVSVRGIDYIAMLDIKSDGRLELKQNIHCGGVNPRGLCLSPDGKFLFAANMISETITTFAIDDSGLLTAVNKEIKGVSPANMSIF